MNTLATTPSIDEPQPGRRVVRAPVSQALAEGKLSRADLRALMQRSNWLPLIHLLLWIGVVAGTGALVWLTMDATRRGRVRRFRHPGGFTVPFWQETTGPGAFSTGSNAQIAFAGRASAQLGWEVPDFSRARLGRIPCSWASLPRGR